MRPQVGLLLLPALSAHGIRIIQSNDDGWAELYMRSFHDALLASGHDAVLSAPAENKSATSKHILTPTLPPKQL
jgi:broad specificity polyphosphatase/5'/3'-nucleotidase SurE